MESRESLSRIRQQQLSHCHGYPSAASIVTPAAISPRVGKQYIFVYHSSRKDIPLEQIQINGKFYPLVLPSDNEFDYTECVVVDDREEAI